MLDHMAEVDEPFRVIRHNATSPIAAQTTLRAADGIAPFQPLLTMKPIAPTTFMPW